MKRHPRHAARVEIVAAAERLRRALGLSDKPYSMRRIQQAVCVVRRHRLVSAKTLVAAGYNATES